MAAPSLSFSLIYTTVLSTVMIIGMGLSGCGKKQPSSAEKYGSLHPKLSLAENTADLEKVLRSDIPVPVGYTLASHEENVISHAHRFDYKGSLDFDQALSFYKQSMEVEGWDIEDLSTASHGSFLCSKPRSSCIISILPLKGEGHAAGSSISIALKEVVARDKEQAHIIFDDQINSKEFYLV